MGLFRRKTTPTTPVPVPAPAGPEGTGGGLVLPDGPGNTPTGVDAVATAGGLAGMAEKVDEWADPPHIDLALADTIVEDGHTPLTDAQALARVGVRLSKGVAFMAPDKADVPLVVHEESDHQAWAWLDEDLTRGGEGALHVCLGPLLAGVDPATVNPLHPDGRRANPSIPGGLAHAAAHLNHTRLDDTLLSEVAWPVRCAATMLEEIRCEAQHIKDRPWDAVYLRASARLWKVPEGEDRWRTAYLALTVLGRRTAGILQPSDTTPVTPLVDAVFNRREKNRMMGIWGKALRLPDGDTAGLIELATQWVKLVNPGEGTVFSDPCATRTYHLAPPSNSDMEGKGSGSTGEADSDDSDQANGSGQAGDAGSDSTDADGSDASSGTQGGQNQDGDNSDSDNGQGGSGGNSQGQDDNSQGQGQDKPDSNQGGGSPSGQDQSGSNSGNQGGNNTDSTGSPWGGAASPDLEWDDPAAAALSQVAEAATTGARQQLKNEAKAQAEREALIKAVTQPLDEATKQARQRREEADKIFARDGQGGPLHTAARTYRQPTPGEERLARHLERELRQAKFRERGKAKVAFDRPPGRLSGRDMMQRNAQRAMGQAPTARPWRRQVYTTTPTPDIHALILADRSGSMKWADKPVAAMTWALSRAVTSVGGRVGALTFGYTPLVLADPGRPLPTVPVYAAKDGREVFTQALRAGDGRMNLASARGVRVIFVISDGIYTAEEIENGTKELERLIKQGVLVVWIALGKDLSSQMAGLKVLNDGIYGWVPDGVHLVSIDSHKTAARTIVSAMAGTIIRKTRDWDPTADR